MPISIMFPGSGINPFTVWDLQLHWWRRYVAEAIAAISAREAAAQ
ncbi:hypothetical protein [Herbiconiux sp. VKM Ac-2851]|nr:hypothetical protein [Herbiconiux sp. VKM Ac-2851]